MALRKIFWITIGLLSFSLGTVGIYLPLIPTVPLYLLASFAFLNSSDRLYRRFKESKLYQKYLLRYLSAGGLSKNSKLYLILFVSLQIAIAAFLLQNSIIGLLRLVLLYLGFLLSILFVVKTIPPKK